MFEFATNRTNIKVRFDWKVRTLLNFEPIRFDRSTRRERAES
jgi:hypothetical protein